MEIPIDSDEADDENRAEGGRTLLNIISRGYAVPARPRGTSLPELFRSCALRFIFCNIGYKDMNYISPNIIFIFGTSTRMSPFPAETIRVQLVID